MAINQWDLIKAKYAASAVRPDQYPAPYLDEVAFIGRSNVGKSSLINSLTRRNGLARVSGSPGKTQTINFYEIELDRLEFESKFSINMINQFNQNEKNSEINSVQEKLNLYYTIINS